MDGVLIINTGDSLIALSVDIEDNHGGFGFGLYSPRVTRSMSNISTMSSDDQVSVDSQDHLSEPKPFEELDNTLVSESVLGGVLAQSSHSNSANPALVSYSLHVPGKERDRDNSRAESSHTVSLTRERHASTGKENFLNSPPLSQSVDGNGSETRRHETPTAKLHRALDVYNFEGSTPKKDEMEAGGTAGEFQDVPNLGSPVASTASGNKLRSPLFAGLQSARMQNYSEDLNLEGDGESPEDQDRTTLMGHCSDVFQKPAEPSGLSGLRLQSRDLPGYSSSRPLSGNYTIRAWQINEINGINDINEINDGLINLCKLGLGLMRINDGLMRINDEK